MVPKKHLNQARTDLGLHMHIQKLTKLTQALCRLCTLTQAGSIHAQFNALLTVNSIYADVERDGLVLTENTG